MPLHYRFEYSLPYTNHITGRPDIVFLIDATMYETGFVYFNPVVSNQVVNPDRMYRDITAIARMEFENIKREKCYRQAEGDKILKAVFQDEKGSEGINTYLIFLIIPLII